LPADDVSEGTKAKSVQKEKSRKKRKGFRNYFKSKQLLLQQWQQQQRT